MASFLDDEFQFLDQLLEEKKWRQVFFKMSYFNRNLTD